MRAIQAAVVISVLLTPAAAFAQTAPTDHVNPGSLRLSAIHVPPEDIYNVAPQPQPQSRERSWPGRHPVLFGALLGLGIGVGVELVVIPGQSGGEPHSAYLPMFGGVGAGIGALTGVIVSAVRR